MNTSTGYYDRPRKIMITLTPLVLATHPFTLVMQKSSVMRFQRSLCDANATSNGLLRELSSSAGPTFTIPYGLGSIKELAKAIYQTEGLWGFYRCFPEYIAYHLVTDVLSYLVPKYVLPAFSDFKFFSLTNVPLHGIFHPKNSLELRYSGLFKDNAHSLPALFVDFYKTQVESDKKMIITTLVIDLVTYPALTIITRLMIYDGYGPVSFFSLLKHTLSVDGPMSFYRGFFFYLLTNCVKYVLKHFEGFSRMTMLSGVYMSPISTQSFQVVGTIVQSVTNQLSLILRCGSRIDGFCVDYKPRDIFGQMPWGTIFTQILLSIGLIQLKERLIEGQIQELSKKIKDVKDHDE